MAKAKVYTCRGDFMADFIEKYATLKTQKAKDNLREKFKAGWDSVKDQHKQQNGKVVKDVAVKTADDFLKLLDLVAGLEGVNIELSGDWLFVSGDTYRHRGKFRDAGMMWHGQRKVWFWQAGKPKFYGKFRNAAKEG